MTAKPEETAQKIAAMLEVMWKSSRATIADRVRVLRDAQQKLAIDALDKDTRKPAVDAAHKLAGVLGTFGLPKAGADASKIEVLLTQETAITGKQQQDLASWLDDLEDQINRKDH